MPLFNLYPTADPSGTLVSCIFQIQPESSTAITFISCIDNFSGLWLVFLLPPLPWFLFSTQLLESSFKNTRQVTSLLCSKLHSDSCLRVTAEVLTMGTGPIPSTWKVAVWPPLLLAPPASFRSSHPAHLAQLGAFQPHSCLKTFAMALPSTWTLFSKISACLTPSPPPSLGANVPF